LTQIDAHIADFAEIGSLGVELRSRPWNSRDAGDVFGSVVTDPGVSGDTTLTIPNVVLVIFMMGLICFIPCALFVRGVVSNRNEI
jgi:hypothetical protein